MNQEMQASGVPTVAPRLNTMALIGFISCFFCGLADMILSIIALVQIGKSGGAYKGKGFAIPGVIIGSLMFIFQTIWSIAFIEGELL